MSNVQQMSLFFRRGNRRRVDGLKQHFILEKKNNNELPLFLSVCGTVYLSVSMYLFVTGLYLSLFSVCLPVCL